jgi:hypothetical protein
MEMLLELSSVFLIIVKDKYVRIHHSHVPFYHISGSSWKGFLQGNRI